LRQSHKSPCRDGAKAVFDTTVFTLKERLSKPDSETFDNQTAPPGSQKMTQLMDDDQGVEKNDDFQQDENEFEYFHNGYRNRSFGLQEVRLTGEGEDNGLPRIINR
jgi:hypothetical protein